MAIECRGSRGSAGYVWEKPVRVIGRWEHGRMAGPGASLHTLPDTGLS
jgi:hypothetical protein